MKRILIIGGNGFIGLNLVKTLLEQEKHITILANNENKIQSCAFFKKVNFVSGSITDYLLVEKLIKDNDVVINLAAVIDKNVEDKIAINSLKVNCLGELNVLEAIKNVNPSCYHIFIGSRTQFGKTGALDKKINEYFPQNPFSLYGIHKQTAEQYINYYHKIYGLKTISLRVSSVYGFDCRGEPNNVIPIFIKKAISNQDINIFGDGNDFKDFLYIDDLTDLFLRLIDLKPTGVFNVGFGEGVIMKDVAKKIISICESNSNIVFKELAYKEKLFELDSCIMDITKIKTITGWSPKISLEEGIGRLKNKYINHNSTNGCFDNIKKNNSLDGEGQMVGGFKNELGNKIKNKMKIVITGGAGFIGSNFIRHMVNKYPQHDFINFDKLTYAGNLDSLKDLDNKDNYSFVRGDICDFNFLAHLLRDVDCLIHLAAESHVDNSFESSLIFTQSNTYGTHVLMEVARQCNIKRIIHVSTDEVYGDILEGSFKEDDKLNPTNPYSASKAAAEMIVKGYCTAYDLPIIIVRGNNNYGSHQFPEKIIPCFITQLLQDQKVPLHGDGKNIRTYIHVEDFCSALDVIFERGMVGETYNIGTHEEISNLELTKLIISKVGKDDSYINFVRDRPFNDKRYSVNVDKLYALGWRPQISFEEGLDKTISWYRDNEWWWKPLIQKRLTNFS
jgi:dTDP-glucose 4,6-dehydratase